MNHLCIIPARGGSKRIPRKNLKLFLGRPILEYPIEAALQSGLFETVMVSTDDEEIADIAKRAEASVPFLRSAENSGDHASTADVLAEVIARFRDQDSNFEFACCCYPTAVFVSPKKLKTALQLLQDEDGDCIFPVSAYTNPILRAFKVENEQLRFMWPEHESTRHQDLAPALPPAARVNGTVAGILG